MQASASELSIDFNIVDNSVVVEQTYRFSEAQSLTFNLPETAKGIDLYIDGQRQEPIIIDNRITTTGKNLKIAYTSKEFIKKKTFLADIPFQISLDKATITVTGDKKDILEKPANYADLTSNSVFPKPDSLVTDGQRLVITWIRKNVKKGDELSIFVQFKKEEKYSLFAIIGLTATIVVLGYLLARKTNKKPITKQEDIPIKETQKEQKYPEIEKHLKEDEEQIISILKQKEGHCEQGTLVIITGFSKAKLSAILKELEERKIIYKEQKGNKNIIYLRTE